MNIYTQCNVTVELTGGNTIANLPSGWLPAKGSMTQIVAIRKEFYENTNPTEVLSAEDVGSELIITVDKIGKIVDETKNYIIEFRDDNLYNAVIQNEQLKDKIIMQLPEAKKIVMTGVDVKEITSLEFKNKNITDLTGIESFINLERLDVSNNNITDLSEIAELVNLKYLFADSNKITNITNLENLNNLETLSLTNNKITNIPQNLILNKISYLTLDNNQIEDITPLTKQLKAVGNTSLEIFSLSENKIQDISSLEGISYGHGNAVKNQKINIQIDTKAPVQLPQILQKAITDSAEITYTDCTKQSDNTIIINDDADGNHEISVEVKSHSANWSTEGTKVTITVLNFPMIILNTMASEDTYIKLDGNNTKMLSLRINNMTEDTINNIRVKVKIGDNIIREGLLVEVFNAIENQEYNLWLGGTETASLNGRITIEIPALARIFKETILDTKYIVNNIVATGKISLTNSPITDTYIAQGGYCCIMLVAENIADPGKLVINLKIGSQIVRTATLEELGFQEMGNWIIDLYNITGEGRITLEIPAVPEVIDETILDTKYIVAKISVTGVTLNKSETTIKVGQTETLTATVSPANATNKI